MHASLNSLYWQYGMHDKYLQSYSVAIQSRPHNSALRLQYVSALLKFNDLDTATQILRQSQQQLGTVVASDTVFHRLSGQLFVKKGLFPEAKESFTTAVKLSPEDIRSREDMARLLIMEGNYQQGLEHIDAVFDKAPFNQSLIAYRSLCWRLLDNLEEASVNDYEHFIRVYRIPLPAGYTDISEFNQSLNRCLDKLHNTRIHPMGQTLRGGTQTQGNVFNHQIKEIQEVRQSISHSVQEYIDSMEDQPEHPFLGRKSKHFRFSDSWSSRLSEQGFHTNHIHPQGWISSCYYVNLPGSVNTSDDKQGWIKFGETNLKLGAREKIARYIQPQEGLLVLFPSYMFHGTVPFHSADERTTIAFDIVPTE